MAASAPPTTTNNSPSRNGLPATTPSAKPGENGAKASPPSPEEKERSRRMKISAANRGRTPWNKGRSLPESVREKIRQRTYEAMQRPEVRARMHEANQHRPPHRQEVKDRIRAVLKERVIESKATIREHAIRIVAAMGASDDPAEQDAAQRDDAVDIVSRVTWRFMKRDFDETYANWEADENGFRTFMVERFAELSKRSAAASAAALRKLENGSGGTRGRRGARSAESKIRRAAATQKKLMEAKLKLTQAETALANVLPMKERLAENPEALKKVLNIEAAVPKLREQVEALTEAMAPLQQYLSPSIDDPASIFSAASSLSRSMANGTSGRHSN